MASKKSSSKENQHVRKSIIRNVEVPLKSDHEKKNKRVTISETTLQRDYVDVQEPQTRRSLHEPRVNKLAEWRKTLNEIKNVQPNAINCMEDVSKSTQDFINRAVSSKLNFPAHQSVFKNLPKIDDNQEAYRPAQKVVPVRKIDGSAEIQRLLDELVEAEYRNEELNKRINVSQSYSDKWLDMDKFKKPAFMLPNQKTETQIYHDQLRDDLFHYLFSSENYISPKVKFNPSRDAMIDPKRKTKECVCLSDFYTQHSMCS